MFLIFLRLRIDQAYNNLQTGSDPDFTLSPSEALRKDCKLRYLDLRVPPLASTNGILALLELQHAATLAVNMCIVAEDSTLQYTTV